MHLLFKQNIIAKLRNIVTGFGCKFNNIIVGQNVYIRLSSSAMLTNSGIRLLAFSTNGDLICSYAFHDSNTCFSHSTAVLHIYIILLSTEIFLYLPVSSLIGVTPNLNLASADLCLRGKNILQ